MTGSVADLTLLIGRPSEILEQNGMKIADILECPLETGLTAQWFYVRRFGLGTHKARAVEGKVQSTAPEAWKWSFHPILQPKDGITF